MKILDLLAGIPINAVQRLQLQTFENEVTKLEKENADLKKRVSQLESELAAKTRLEEFVEHHGALFKRKPGGGYHSAVYCPRCKQRSEERRVGKECRSRWSPY